MEETAHELKSQAVLDRLGVSLDSSCLSIKEGNAATIS